MKKVLFIILAIMGILSVFHVVHFQMYCKYQKVIEKSHCKECSHRPICQKYHKKRWK